MRRPRDAEVAAAEWLRSSAPADWKPDGDARSFIKYSRRLRRNGHRATGYATAFGKSPAEHALVRSWAAAGVVGNFVVVDHESGRVGHPTWASAYVATCEWDGGVLAPSVRSSIGQPPSIER